MLYVRKLVGVLVVLLAGGLVLAQPPAPKEPPVKKETGEKKPATLEEMLARALRDNPDVRVAEAKLREAEAELNRTRLAVAQKVIAAVTALERARKVAEDAEARYRRLQKLADGRGVSKEAVDEAALALALAKAEVAKLEADLPLLFGRLSDRDDVPALIMGWKWAPVGAEGPARPAAPTRPAVSGPMAEKIRKALDTPVQLEVKLGTNLIDILDQLTKRYDFGVPFRCLTGDDVGVLKPMPLFPKVPLAAFLEALEDSFTDVRFVVREYGIAAGRAKDLPPDALRAVDFWRAGAPKEASDKPAPGAMRNPPPEAVEGAITQVDEKTGLVTISLGSDSGLQEGHTLEVYRLKPTPKYLGTLRIINVQPRESVGRMLNRPMAAVEVGDKVASRILGGS